MGQVSRASTQIEVTHFQTKTPPILQTRFAQI
jgi:hypothetical protein